MKTSRDPDKSPPHQPPSKSPKPSPVASPSKPPPHPTPVQDPLEQAIQFLKDKGVYQDNPIIAEVHFSLLLEPPKAGVAENHYRSIQQRLLRLTSADTETHSDTVPAALHTFDETEFPGYEKEDVFFLKHGNALCQRYQRSGLCYMHGPAMVQHYALQFNGTAQPMLDLVKYIREHFTAKQLEQHLFHDAGGDSISFLHSILEEGTVLIGVTGELDTIPDKFALYGPALVSRFEVHSDFYDNQHCHFHYGKPTGEVKGNHAMVLVGHRKDIDGKRFFLLQNWWRKKQFVEVDEEYLVASGALITFVKTPQNGIPTSFATSHGRYFELEMIDKPEGIVGEMELM